MGLGFLCGRPGRIWWPVSPIHLGHLIAPFCHARPLHRHPRQMLVRHRHPRDVLARRLDQRHRRRGVVVASDARALVHLRLRPDRKLPPARRGEGEVAILLDVRGLLIVEVSEQPHRPIGSKADDVIERKHVPQRTLEGVLKPLDRAILWHETAEGEDAIFLPVDLVIAQRFHRRDAGPCGYDRRHSLAIRDTMYSRHISAAPVRPRHRAAQVGFSVHCRSVGCEIRALGEGKFQRGDLAPLTTALPLPPRQWLLRQIQFPQLALLEDAHGLPQLRIAQPLGLVRPAQLPPLPRRVPRLAPLHRLPSAPRCPCTRGGTCHSLARRTSRRRGPRGTGIARRHRGSAARAGWPGGWKDKPEKGAPQHEAPATRPHLRAPRSPGSSS